MKNTIILLSVLLFLLACKEEPKDYIIIKGLIANNNATYIDIEKKGFNKRITIDLDGTFSDTLKVAKADVYRFSDGKNRTLLHLENGNVINIQYDYKDLTSSIKVKGSETSIYLTERAKLDKKENLNKPDALYKLGKEEFTAKINSIDSRVKALLSSDKLDSVLKKKELKRNEQYIGYVKKQYTNKHYLLTKFVKGTPSPKFNNYEDYNGGTKSLDDFKGKVVYIDVWATWCGPCKREIPYLKVLEEEFKNKKIEFVSISVDNGRGYKNDPEKAKDGWRKMITSKKMGGIQLYADKAWGSDFIKAYGIRSIPRFILIDAKGNIVNANAPRPSSKTLKPLLESLL